MSSQLENFVSNIRNLCSRGNFQEARNVILKNWDLLLKNLNNLDNLLQIFDISNHSLGYLAVLGAKLSVPDIPDFDTVFGLVQGFIARCNGEQIRSAGDLFADMCHKFTQHLITLNQPIRGIQTLVKAVEKVQLHSQQLTSVHADLCQLSLLAKCFKPAVAILDIDITDIAKEGNEFDSKYFLLYYYYGGMVYAAVKNYERALYFFEIAITTPSAVVSHIVLESYKKLILISLILHGKLDPLPKYTASVVQRYVKPLCQPYHELADAFTSCKQLPDNDAVFAKDKNIGLVKQVRRAFHKNTIQSLTKTFLTLSLADVAHRASLTGGPNEAEEYLLEMIEEGQIHAVISQQDGMVRFLDNPERYDDPSMLSRIDEQMQRCYALCEKLQKMDQDMTVNPAYVRKLAGSSMEDDSASITSGKSLTN